MTAARLLAAISIFALAGAAYARPRSPANAHFERGNQLYRDGQYAAAAGELKRGYDLDPRADILYAIGQAERQAGDCKEALRYYQQYLDTAPSQTRRAAAQMQIDRCNQELATAPPAPPPAPAPVVTPTPAPPPPAPPAPPEAARATPPARVPVYKRWWLWTTIVGAVAIGAGVGVGVALSQKPTFDSTLPDLVIARPSLEVRF